MKSRSRVKEVVGSNYVLGFGKHVGRAICWVLVNDPSYIVWLVDNDVLSLGDDVYEEAKLHCSDVDDMNDYIYGDAGDLY